VRSACEQCVPLPQALTQRIGAAGPRFVPQTELPESMAYEQFIFDTGTVPTRDGLHDFFNGLCWMRFPATKRQLNRLQAAELAKAGVGQVRGPVRDAITLFDENAVLLQAPSELWDALIAREWTRLFVELRPLWAQARLVLFGHALLEKLVSPYKSITAHVYKAQAAPENVAKTDHTPRSTSPHIRSLDHQIAQHLSPASLVPKPFIPLPVLGVPGWWAANADAQFYADAQVFRPPPPVANAANP
jgi:Protein of unknown function (DUF3025)